MLIYFKYSLSLLDFQRYIALVVAIAAIFSSLPGAILIIDSVSATSEEGDNGGGDEPAPEPEPELEPEPEPEPSPDPGIVPGPEPLADPCLESPEAEGCASEPPVDPCIENPNAEGCKPDPGLVGPTPQPMPPYEGCLLDPTLPECTPPPGGKCPPGTLMNGYGQCYPDKPCPPGYARADNDESGACLPLNTPTPTPTPTPGGNCDPSYPEDCIPPPPPDLDCGDDGVPNNVKVLQPDPHRLDGDKNGVGCEGSSYSGGGNGNSNNGGGSSSSTSECQGQADCFRGTVTEIVDGDTLDINNVRVRLALINTPERGQSGYTEAIDLVQSVCDVGTTALVDEDDGQKEGSFDRVIGIVYCGDDNINSKKSLNELILDGGYADIYGDFCNVSEFAPASWAQRYGC
jgi:hypothetical protein